jgi:DNA repair exonuclease SbcCD ATPase subunit
MKLTKISIKYFKGLRSFDLEAPEGKSINIYGKNAKGKSTIADAITWVLTDKDTQGRSPQNFGIKTVDKNGEVIHNLEHEVEATFIEPDITLRKVYQEKWTRSRGSSHKDLSGHTTDYYVDDEPVKKKDYESAIAEIMSDEQFKILTVPSYFAEQVHWSTRRKTLAKIAGDVNEDEIIESDPELSDYKEILDGKSAESRKKILTEQRKKYLEQIDNIPDRIDENVMAMVEVDAKGVDKKITELTEKKSEVEEQLAKARSGGGVSDLQVKIEELESQKQALKAKHNEEVDAKMQDARDEVDKAREAFDKVSDELADLSRKSQDIERLIESCVNKASGFQEKLDEAKESEPKPRPEKYDNELGDTCPYCGQDMPDTDEPEHDVESEYEEYLAEFNQNKASTIKYLKEMVDESNKEHESLQSDLKKVTDEYKELHKEYERLSDVFEKAKANRDSLKDSFDDVTDSDEYKVLLAKQDALEKKVDAIRTNKSEHITEIQERLGQINTKISELEETKFEVRKNQERQERIEELKAELKIARKSLEEAENGLYVIQRFDVAQAEVITKKVNKMFDIVEWKMFEPQINGGVNDQMCEATVNGVAYGDGLNNAMRIQAGLDIINTLGNHYGKSAPVVVDNAEAINEMNTYDLQVIALYVSKHEKLKVEVA